MGGARSIICGSETGGIPVWQLELAVRPRRGQAERTRFFYFGPPDTRAVRKSLPPISRRALFVRRYIPRMAHYLFNFSDGVRQRATGLLRARMWGVGRYERHRDTLAPGDLALRPGTASTSQPRGNPHSSTVVHADDDPLLDPRTEPAPIRAMFVHAEWTRRGLGTAILQHAETAAKAEGFSTRSLLATLPGFPLSCGTDSASSTAATAMFDERTSFRGLCVRRPGCRARSEVQAGLSLGEGFGSASGILIGSQPAPRRPCGAKSWRGPRRPADAIGC